MAGALAVVIVLVVLLPALFLATGAAVCAAFAQMLQRDWPKR